MSAYEGLNPKHRRFVDEYLIDLHGTNAAIRAGYTPSRAKSTASELLARQDVEEAVAERQSALSERAGVAAERVINELALLGFSNAMDYIRIGDDGQPYTDFSQLTREQAAAITEVTVETRTEYDTDDKGDRKPVPVRKVRFKLADKRAPLVDLGKHLGLFKERPEDPNKPAANTAALSDNDAARRVAFILAKATREGT